MIEPPCHIFPIPYQKTARQGIAFLHFNVNILTNNILKSKEKIPASKCI